jgi:Xaa-Pro aminopeptidase
MRANDESIPKSLRGIGIRIEDDVLILKDDADVLSKISPTNVEAIEELCAL